MPRRLTSASFEIRHLSNAIRLMIMSFDKQAQTARFTLNRITMDGEKSVVSSNTLTISGGGFRSVRIDNLKAGFYELSLRLSNRKLKPSVDIRDGSNSSDAEYSRFLIPTAGFVRPDS